MMIEVQTTHDPNASRWQRHATLSLRWGPYALDVKAHGRSNAQAIDRATKRFVRVVYHVMCGAPAYVLPKDSVLTRGAAMQVYEAIMEGEIEIARKKS